MAKDHALSGALPNTDVNCLTDSTVLQDHLKHPETRRIAIVHYDVDSIKHKISTGNDLATIRILALEQIPDGTRAEAAREVARECYQERTGKLELDFSSTDEAADDDADEG